ncbi:SPASM domain-containing protein [Pelagibacteraceae bacterium]|nr:SPASM domain-containing protein [Pelagibacteraceae bacterium]
MTNKEEIKFYDPQIDIKKKLVDRKLQFIKNTYIPLPSEVEISESGMCNRKCSFCPRSDPKYDHVNEFISNNLHSKLCNELKELEFAGTIRYSGFVEPLLDKNIYNLLNYAKKTNPKANLEMVTNGDVLNEKRLLKLYESGLDKLQVSVYDGLKEFNEFKELGKKLNLTNEQYILRARYLPPEQDFGITLSNRAGMLKNAEHKIMPLQKQLQKKCFYPSYTFFMDYNGDVLMCAHDWGKKNLLGNLKNEKFLDIWLSDKARLSRDRLNKADRGFKPCNICDVKGDLIGKKHSDAWIKKNKNDKK